MTTSPARPSPAEQRAQERLLDGLVQLSFAVQGVLAEVGAEHDLTLTQVRLLGILRDRDAAMSQVAAHLGLDRSSVSGLVERAERRGLVERMPSSEDGRGVIVGVTAAGRALTRSAETVVRQRVLALTTGLTKTERRRLTGLAERVLETAGPALDRDRPGSGSR